MNNKLAKFECNILLLPLSTVLSVFISNQRVTNNNIKAINSINRNNQKKGISNVSQSRSQNVEISFKFCEQKTYLTYERHKYILGINARLQAQSCVEQDFYDVKKTKISHNCASCGPTVVESEFMAQIKGKINISIDFEMSYLKSPPLWNQSYFILRTLPIPIPLSRKILIVKKGNL